MAKSFVVKLEQVSTYILLKFKTINNKKQNIVQERPLTAKIKIRIKFRAFAHQRHHQG